MDASSLVQVARSIVLQRPTVRGIFGNGIFLEEVKIGEFVEVSHFGHALLTSLFLPILVLNWHDSSLATRNVVLDEASIERAG